jgi:hypothetical protein
LQQKYRVMLKAIFKTLRFIILILAGHKQIALLEKDSPDSRSVQSVGEIIAIPYVGGLHHRYERRIA